MNQLVNTIRRVTVICETVLERRLIEKFIELGARGYTVSDCRGKGHHHVIADPFTGRTQVKIEVLCQKELAQKMIDYMEASIFKNYAVMAYVDNVMVASGEQF